MAKRVALFSPFSPDLGGGGTNLRSLVPELQSVDVQWFYTAHRTASFPGTTRIGPPIGGGPLWRDLSTATALWLGIATPSLRNVVSALARSGASSLWVVGHNEGVLVARALVRAGARVHLTIQDDVPDGMFRRSRRYRALAALAQPVYESTLRRVASIDVTSDGMQAYYKERLGLSTVVVHPYVARLGEPPESFPPNGEIRVGHVGSIYAPEQWRMFVEVLAAVAKARGVRARMIMIGIAPILRTLASKLGDVVEVVDDLPEHEAIKRLSACHFLYAMYPFEARSEVFRRTSLPTKITTYLQAQRPILVHSPRPSTLLDVVERFGLGVSCTSNTQDAIATAIGGTLDAVRERATYEGARREVYGFDNVERLRACLDAL
jgi:hypothetical protein